MVSLNVNPRPFLQSTKTHISEKAARRSHAYTQVWVPACCCPCCLECSCSLHDRRRLLCPGRGHDASRAAFDSTELQLLLKFPVSPTITNFHASIILLFKLTLFVSEVSQLFLNCCLTGLRVSIIILFNMISWEQLPSQKVWSVLLTCTISIDIPSCCPFARSGPTVLPQLRYQDKISFLKP